MRLWTKYLVVGWSLVCIGIVIVSFQVMKRQFIEEDFEVMLVYQSPQNTESGENIVGEDLFHGKDWVGKAAITKENFVDRIKKAKGFNIWSKHRVVNKGIFLYLPLYAFAVWAVPIVVLSLIGVLFSREKTKK
jgi:hypothetical protein